MFVRVGESLSDIYNENYSEVTNVSGLFVNTN